MKTILKSELKFVPVIGWGAYFCEHIFVKRNWEKEKSVIAKDMQNFFEDYSKDFHFNVTSIHTITFCDKYLN